MLKGGEKKADWLGPQYPNNDMVMSLRFSFCLRYPRCGAEEGSNLEMPTNAYKICPNKCLLSLANGLGKGQPSKTENL